jgi:hypothetical protein
MNRFIGLIITVVAVAALVGAAIGWRFPFLGQNRTATRVSNTALPDRRGNTAGTQPANAPTNTAPQGNTGTAEPADEVLNPEAPETQAAPSNQNQPIPALW